MTVPAVHDAQILAQHQPNQKSNVYQQVPFTGAKPGGNSSHLVVFLLLICFLGKMFIVSAVIKWVDHLGVSETPGQTLDNVETHVEQRHVRYEPRGAVPVGALRQREPVESQPCNKSLNRRPRAPGVVILVCASCSRVRKQTVDASPSVHKHQNH